MCRRLFSALFWLGLAAWPTAGQDQAAPAESVAACVVDLANGDKLEGRILSFDAGGIRFAPNFAPQSELTVAHDVLLSLTFPEATRLPAPESEFVLELSDYSQVFGRFRGLEGDQLVFEIGGVGEVRLSRSLAWVLRGTADGKPIPVSEKARPGEHVVILENGAVLVGGLEQREDGRFFLQSPEMEAAVNPQAMRVLLFPQEHTAPVPPAEDGEAEADTVFTIQLINDTVLNGRNPLLEGERLRLDLTSGPQVEVNLGLVRDIMMSSGNLTGARDILVWAPFADEDEELRHVLEALKKGIPENRLVVSKALRFDSVFAGQLFRARALVVPEMEEFRDNHLGERPEGATLTMQEDVEQNLRPLLATFLRRGGNVVFLSVQNGAQKRLFDALELIDVGVQGSQNGTQVAFNARGRKIGLGLDGQFRTANATYFYQPMDDQAELWTDGENNRSPILGRRIGRGYVILMGMDFYESNEAIDRVLLNAVQFQ